MPPWNTTCRLVRSPRILSGSQLQLDPKQLVAEPPPTERADGAVVSACQRANGTCRKRTSCFALPCWLHNLMKRFDFIFLLLELVPQNSNRFSNPVSIPDRVVHILDIRELGIQI